MVKRFDNLAQPFAVFILAAGCFLVLRPFLAATLLAAVVCISTWPFYLWLLRKMKGRKSLAALTMTLSLALLVILPLALVAYNLSDDVTAFYDGVKQALAAGSVEPPAWLSRIPLAGASADKYWRHLAGDQEAMAALAQRFLEPAKDMLLAGGLLFGQGVMEMSLAALAGFFFYRDGIALMHFFNVAMEWAVGTHAANILGIINNTVRGVMYGLLGTALAQSIVAAIGFAIAGVPEILLLSTATFMLSPVLVAPPLIWGGATIWLLYQGDVGAGVFMLLWGIFLISSVDNVVEPLLISRGCDLPFILVLFGVMGGILAFGFIGVFIGPTLLAVGLNLIQEWAARASLRAHPHADPVASRKLP